MEDRKSQQRKPKKEMRKKNTASVFLYITTEIFLYRFEYFNLHYITKMAG